MRRFGSRPGSTQSGAPSRSARPRSRAQLEQQGGNQAQADGVQTQGPSAGFLDQLDSDWDRVQSGGTLLRRGSRGPTVATLQGKLNQQGANLSVDQIFGPKTDAAVRQAQRSNGLKVDGVVGPNTAAALDGAAPPQREQRSPQAAEQDARDARAAAQGTGSERDEEQQVRQSPAQRREGDPPINVSPNQFERYGLRADVLENALDVFRTAWRRGDTRKLTYSVIDFSLPSTEKRLFVMDLETGKMLFNELVTHGSGSGGNMTTEFSNRSGSHQSSIGLAKTAETYQSSKFGSTALRLDGLEEGFNDNMRDRAIVMHQANYATQGTIDANGGARLGRSQGCPALDPAIAGEVIEEIKNGTLIYSYYPDPDYMNRSDYQA